MSPKQLPLSLALAGIALSLSGCGSTSSEGGTPVDLASQSVEGTLALTVIAGSTSEVPSNGSMSFYLDADQMYIRADVDTGVVKAPHIGDFSLQEGVLLNASAKTLTVFSSQTSGGKATRTCVVHQIPVMPPLVALKMQIKLLLHRLKVVGIDGGLRRLEANRTIPLPGKKVCNDTASADVAVDLDSGNVVHAGTANMKARCAGGDDSVDLVFHATSAVAGAPNATHFQEPSEWGDCTAALGVVAEADAAEAASAALPSQLLEEALATLLEAVVEDSEPEVPESEGTPAVPPTPHTEVVV